MQAWPDADDCSKNSQITETNTIASFNTAARELANLKKNPKFVHTGANSLMTIRARAPKGIQAAAKANQ
jgi:hypothetical protein